MKSLRRSLQLGALVLVIPVASLFMGGCPNNGNDNTNENTNENTNTNENSNTSEPPKSNTGLTGNFAGSERCGLCHSTLHTNWSNTLHSHALELLESIGQDKNSDCVGCHTVGYGEPGGWVDHATTDALSGVGCESCHGGAMEHVSNVEDPTKRPPVNIAASVCGRCHTDEHHPNYEDWQTSKHANSIEPSHATAWAAGTPGNLTNCGKCHSGDFFYHSIIQGETIGDDYLKGKTKEEMNPITCAVCHDPHMKTGNASSPEDGRDYQLRYPEVKFPTPTNDLAAVQDPTRFNICGQCHHARNNVWTDTSREPHPSDQSNVFFGEMPLPASDPTPLVPSRPSVHLNTADQCRTCHVFRKPFESDIAPTVSGHTFLPLFDACAECHGSKEIGEAKFNALEIEMTTRSDRVKAALDAWTADPARGNGLDWKYTSDGGPATAQQAKIPNEIKKARYLLYYVLNGGGNGVHNPDYVRECLVTALELAENAPARLP